MPNTFDFACRDLRKSLKGKADAVRELLLHEAFEGDEADRDYDDMYDNVELAFRHLEDATMRLGKAIQAYDGGVSVYKD